MGKEGRWKGDKDYPKICTLGHGMGSNSNNDSGQKGRKGVLISDLNPRSLLCLEENNIDIHSG